MFMFMFSSVSVRVECWNAEKKKRRDTNEIANSLQLAAGFAACHVLIAPPGKGGTPIYKVYRYVPLWRVGFLSSFV